ncbi:MAG: M28 family peptidase [Pseudomonadota bacterium]
MTELRLPINAVLGNSRCVLLSVLALGLSACGNDTANEGRTATVSESDITAEHSDPDLSSPASDGSDQAERSHDAAAAAISATAAAVRDEAMAGTDAYELLASLTFDVGARLAGSDGDRRAVAWALDMLEQRGFENVRREPVKVPRWQRGELTVHLVDIDRVPLVATSLGGSVGTADGGVVAAVVGVSSLAELREMDASAVAGKIVFIDQRMGRSRDGAGYGATVGNRVSAASVAAELGALALVIRSVGTAEARIAHTGIIIYKPGVRRIPAVALAHQDADRLAYLLESRREVRLRVQSTARSLDAAESANVIAEIPGTDAADEIIVLAAHLDSWDLGTGALDDGAGVAIVTKAAELLRNREPALRRTVRVVLFANEEYGLSGSNQYRTDHADEFAQHVLAFESDFGAGRIWQVRSLVPESTLPVIADIAAVLAPLDITQGDNQTGDGADIRVLRDAGVPILSLDQDGTHYFDYHHTVDDTLDKVKRADLDQNVAAVAAATYIAATTSAALRDEAPGDAIATDANE